MLRVPCRAEASWRAREPGRPFERSSLLTACFVQWGVAAWCCSTCWRGRKRDRRSHHRCHIGRTVTIETLIPLTSVCRLNSHPAVRNIREPRDSPLGQLWTLEPPRYHDLRVIRVMATAMTLPRRCCPLWRVFFGRGPSVVYCHSMADSGKFGTSARFRRSTAIP